MIRIGREILMPSYNLPVSDRELRLALSMVDNDLEGLCGIKIVTPRRNVEFDYFGRYDCNNSLILLYAHLKEGYNYIVGRKGSLKLTASELKAVILANVFFHEMGHHVGLIRYGNSSEEFAENYAMLQKTKLKRED